LHVALLQPTRSFPRRNPTDTFQIRCDAEGEGPGHKKCGNCTRTAATCDFSRVPMKRGPSKG
jgi:hypothetical protein